MKQIVVLFIIMFMGSTKAFSGNTQILKCKVSNPEWNSLFILDAVGTGLLKFKKNGNNTSYTCGLKVDYINDGQRAVSPHITLEFIRGTCNPDLENLEQELFDRYTLIVDLTKKGKPEGRVQWLRKKQPDLCVVEKMSMFDISMNAKKWIEGTWGRKTASEPKDQKKKK